MTKSCFLNSTFLSLPKLQEKIDVSFCKKTSDKLSDKALLPGFLKCKSFEKALREFSGILDDASVSATEKALIINEWLPELIPPGVKSDLRSSTFNAQVAQTITNLNLSPERFNVKFTNWWWAHPARGKSDWFITEKSTGKTIAGINRITFFGSSQTIASGYQNVVNNRLNTPFLKVLCVTSRKPPIFKKENKVSKIYAVGFSAGTLTFLPGLSAIIQNFFD